MFAMRYGCIPIVRRTGGLVDTVPFYDPVNEAGTGYCFDRYEPLDFFTAMVRTWEGFRYKEDWKKLQQRAMKKDFSWYRSAIEYIKIYKEITGQSGELSEEETAKLQALTSGYS
jgi:starch synthase